MTNICETHDTIENIVPGTPEFEKRREENLIAFYKLLPKEELEYDIRLTQDSLRRHRVQAENLAVDAELNRRYAMHDEYILRLMTQVLSVVHNTTTKPKRRKNR